MASGETVFVSVFSKLHEAGLLGLGSSLPHCEVERIWGELVVTKLHCTLAFVPLRLAGPGLHLILMYRTATSTILPDYLEIAG